MSIEDSFASHLFDSHHCRTVPFKSSRVIAAWRKVGAAPVLDRNALNHPKVRHEAGGGAPEAAALEALEERHAANLAAAENAGLNAQVFGDVKVPTRSHVAREPTEVARVAALVASGSMSASQLWRTTGAVAINGWQVFAAEEGQAANAAKEAAMKSLSEAQEVAQALDAAEAAAAARGDNDDASMKGPELSAAVKAVYLISDQAGRRSNHNTKPKALAFLSGLEAPWASLLPAGRAANNEAIAGAKAALAKAEADAAAALARGPVAPPTVAPASDRDSAIAVRATTTHGDMSGMSPGELRELVRRASDALAARE